MGARWGAVVRSILAKRWFAVEDFRITSYWEVSVPVSRAKIILTDPMSILRWWPAVFLHGEILEDPEDTLIGFAARFHTKGFLPHTFQFVATIIEQTTDRIVVTTKGDFDGIGTIHISERNGQSRIAVEWRVSVDHPYVQPFLHILKPVFVWNHLWAMRQGKSGLEAVLTDENITWRSAQRPTFPHNLAALRVPSQWRL